MASIQPFTTTGAFFRCPGCGELIEAELTIDPRVEAMPGIARDPSMRIGGSFAIHVTPKVLGVRIEHYCGQAKRSAESSAATIHVCDATCLCGGRCAEVEIPRDRIARSSLGSPEAAALRESIPPELAERTLRRAAEMERDAAIAERDALRRRILALADSLKEENR